MTGSSTGRDGKGVGAGNRRRPSTRGAVGLAHHTPWRDVVVCACLCAIVAVALSSVPALRLPRFVSSLSVANPTEEALQIDFSGPSQSGWMPLGTVGPRSRLDVEEVFDQGGAWVFRLRRSADGRAYALLQVTREQLVDAHWSITVPHRDLDLRRSAELDRINAAGP